MKPSPLSPDAQDFRAHAEWIGRLADSLLRSGAASAEDAAQDALIAAWTRPPEKAPVRPWLARVLRNGIRARHRSDRARRERERTLSVDEPNVDPTDLTMERVESQRRVLDAVLSLPDAYRRVIVLRYYEDLNSRQIATRLDIAPGTARSQLQRALVLLRERIEGGDKNGHRCILLATSGISSSGSKAATGVIMGLQGKMLVGTAAIILIGVLFIDPFSWSTPEEPSQASTLVVRNLKGAASSPHDGRAERKLAHGAGKETSNNPTGRPMKIAADRPLSDKPSIRGQVVSAKSGAPITDAVVHCRRDHETALSSGSRHPVDDNGQFAIVVPANEIRSLLIRSPTHVDQDFTEIRTGDEQVLVLRSGVAVTGRVVDDVTGDPLTRAEVRFGCPPVETQVDGMFHLVAPTLSMNPTVHRTGYTPWGSAPYAARADDPPLEIRLISDDAHEPCYLRFLDPLTGLFVRPDAAEPGPMEELGSGVYRVGCNTMRRLRSFTIWSDGSVPIRFQFSLDRGQTFDDPIDLPLPRAQTITGRVVDETGQPIAGALVEAEHRFTRSLPAGWDIRPVSVSRASSDANGRYVLESILPNSEYLLGTTSHTAATRPRIVVATAAGSETVASDLAFPIGKALRGQVVAARTGEPISGAVITVRSGGEPIVTRSDGTGRFALKGLSDSVRVQVAAAGRAPFDQKWNLASRPMIKVLLREGLAIEGIVMDASGAPVFGATVTASIDRESLETNDRATRDLLRFSARSEADGSFRIHGLWPGDYHILASRGEESNSPLSSHRGALIAAGSSGVVLSIRYAEGITLQVKSALNGEPVTEFIGWLRSLSGEPNSGGSGNSRGITFLAMDPTDSYRLELNAPGFATVVVNELRAAPGERRELEIQMQPGASFGGVVRDTAGAPLERVSIVPFPLDGSRPFVNGAWTDQTGRFSFKDLPEGSYGMRVTAVLRSGPVEVDRAVRVEPSNFTLGPGQDLSQDLVVETPIGASIVGVLHRQEVDDLERIHIRFTPVADESRGRTDRKETGRKETGRKGITINAADISAFRVDGVPPGSYEIEVFIRTHDSSGRFDGIPVTAEPKKVTVPKSGEIALDLTAVPTGP